MDHLLKRNRSKESKARMISDKGHSNVRFERKYTIVKLISKIKKGIEQRKIQVKLIGDSLNQRKKGGI